MNSTNPNSTSARPLIRRAPILAAAASLLLAPCLHAQTPAPAVKEALVPAAPAQGSAAQPAPQSGVGPNAPSRTDDRPPYWPPREKVCTLKFAGGTITDLCKSLKAEFPSDNVVLSESAARIRLPDFELLNVRLSEIGRTIEFLSEGQLSVEVADKAGVGTLWRIGRKNAAEAAASVKMRSVAAPHLFADEEKVKGITESAREMEMRRLDANGVIGGAGGKFRGADVRPLKSQGIFVIIGDEDGVAGVESLIKAAEQRLAESAAAKAAAVAANGPKMRAVLAPHVFAAEKRVESVRITLGVMRERLAAVDDDIRKVTGSEAVRVGWANAEPRKEQKVFLLLGAEAGIAGMESLIKAAEQLAAEEDAKLDAEMNAVRAQKEADLQAAKDRAKAEKREQ